MNTLGDHIRKRRLDLSLLQREVAQKIGVSESTIWNWEANQSNPQLRFVPTIIAFLRYDPYDTQSGSLCERMVACRHKQGLSQRELARRLGVDPTTLGKWERGESQPLKIVLALAEAFLAAELE